MSTKYIKRADLRISGIYFIMHRGKIVYIGKSVNVMNRIATHEMITNKEWDHVRVIPCPIDKLLHYEVRWIKKFKPEYNHRHVKRYVWNGYYGDISKRTKVPVREF